MSNRIIRALKATNSGIASATTAAEVNSARISYTIQNLGTNILYVKEGDGASATDFSFILAGGDANDDGYGAFYESPAGQVFSGKITIAGTSPRYIITQRTERDNSN